MLQMPWRLTEEEAAGAEEAAAGEAAEEVPEGPGLQSASLHGKVHEKAREKEGKHLETAEEQETTRECQQAASQRVELQPVERQQVQLVDRPRVQVEEPQEAKESS